MPFRSASAFVFASSLFVGSLLAAGCGTDNGGDGSGDGGIAPSFSTGGGDGGPGGLGSLAACATSKLGATLKPLNLVFLYDKSGSMGDKTRIYDCGGGGGGNQDITCSRVKVTGPGGSAEPYVCRSGNQNVQFTSLTTAVVGSTTCPNGTVGGDSAIVCADPSACQQVVFFDPAEKWVPVEQGVTAFFGDPKSTGMSASLAFFPKFQGDSSVCQASGYATPAVSMRPLPDQAPFKTAIAGEQPRGNTPTEVALKGTIEYAKSIQSSRPNDATAIVLVTDGEPTECGQPAGQNISVVKAVAAGAAAANPPLKTYVIGVGTSLNNLNEIAAGGGTGKATLVTVGNGAKTSADLMTALESIRGKELSCDIPLPKPPDGKQLDVNAVNVVTNIGGVDDVLTYNKDCAGGTGWHYDNAASPTRVEICPTTCSDVRAKKGSLTIAFGCATKGGVK